MDVLEETELAQWRLKSSHASLYVMLVLKKLLFVGFLLRDFVSSFYYGVKWREGDNDVLMSQNLISACNINIFQEIVSLCFSRHLPIFIIEKLQRERHIATILLLINKDKSILNINNIILDMNCRYTKHIFVCNDYCRQEN